MTYGVVRAFQVIVNTLLCSPEKADVGGSTPSLATTFQSTYTNRALSFSPLSVRIRKRTKNGLLHIVD